MADYLLGYVSDLQLSNVWVVEQRHWAHDVLRRRTTGRSNSQAVAEPRPALRLHHAGARSQQRADQLRSGRRRQPRCSPADGSLEDRGLVKPDRNNFAPRVGVVYKLDDKTLIRGGWGIFYNLFDRVGSEDQLALNLPGLVNKTITQTSGSPVFFLRQGFPANFLTVPNLDPAAGQLKAVRLRAVTNDAPKTTINQASFGMQRELLTGMVLSADFVYTRGSNLATLVNLNQPLPNAAGNNALGAAAVPELRLHRVARAERQVDVQGPRPRPREALLAGATRSASSYTHRRFEGQHVGAADDAGVERVSAELARLQPVVRTERLRRAPPVHDQLRGRPAARPERLRARLGGVRRLRVALGPSLHREPERQQRRHEHDRPAEPGRRCRRDPRPSISGSTSRRSRRCTSGHVRQRAAQPASRSELPERRPDDPAADQVQPIAWRPRCGGTSSTCSTRPTSVCRTGTSPTSAERTRRSAPLRAWRATRASCSSRCD